jgi:hypothetical protein
MTILFYDEWMDKYPHAIVDTKTDNHTFLRYSALLKSMGIKNHAFPLMLIDKELQGVDPFDPNISQELMLRFALECKNCFWTYIRAIAKTKEADRFRANRGNMAMFWLFFNHITTILIQIRQTGKSFSTDTLMTYLLNIACQDTEINLLTKDDTLRASNLTRLKDIQMELPFYLRQHTRGDVGNTEELSIKALGNRYRGHLPNKSPKMALNVGRGLTSPVFQVDEAAFFYNIAISMPAALAAGTAARDLARRRGTPYGTVITTTAGKKDDKDGAYIYNMVQNSAIWTEKFFDCKNEEDLRATIRRNSPKGELRVNCTFNHRQLGYTDAWLKNAIEEANVTGEDADRDFGNVWSSGSQTSPLPVELSTLIRDSQVNDCYIQISSPYSYVTRWYIPEDKIHYTMATDHHILSVDSSDAAGGDDIALKLRSVKTGAIIASGNYNETNLITFSEWLCTWLVDFEKVTLIIERRSTGAMILDYLLLMLPSKNIDPFRRIYNKIVQEAEEDPDRFKEISKPMYTRDARMYTEYKKAFGFATSGTGTTSRTELYSATLLNAAKLTGDRVRDPKTIDQILSLVIRNGRVDHLPGEQDDLVIAWILSFWILVNGKNLHFYGINSRDILLENSRSQKTENPVSRYDQLNQIRVRSQIESIVEEIKKERDDYVVMRLEAKLRSLATELTDEDRKTLSVDELMVNLREHRRNNRSARRYF